MALFGDLFGKAAQSSTKVAGFHQPYLEDVFGRGTTAVDKAIDAGPYQGQLFARLQELQRQGVNAAGEFANGAGAALPGAAASASLTALGAGANAGSNAQRIMEDFSGGNLIQRALQQANSGSTDALVDAATRDVTRNLTENTLPSIQQAATSTNNRGSSRAGVAEGIALRGAQDRIADIGADVRNDVFGRALQGEIAAGNTALGANSQLSSLFGQGLGGLQTSFGLAGDRANLLTGAGSILQGEQQGILNEQRDLYDMKRGDELALIERLRGIIGSPIMESQSTGEDPGAIARLAGGIKNIGNIGASFAGFF